MGDIIPFRKRKQKTSIEADFNEILKDVVEIRKKSLELQERGIYRLNVNFEDLMKAKICSFIMDHRLMNADIFRCGLYVSRVLGETLSKRVGSYYVSDYFTRGIEEDDPFVLQQGADLCCVFCVLFDERKNWRMMKTGDYARLGTQLYALYFAKTKKLIGLCMSRNFGDIVEITKKCVLDMERGM